MQRVNLSLEMADGIFPNPRTFAYPAWAVIGPYMFRSDDVVSFGTPLTVETAREAYIKGIFPWNTEGLPLPWHCPAERAVLFFDELNVPRSLARERRKKELRFTIDEAFETVIHECSLATRPGQSGTWISAEFESVYTELYRQGMAHSVEAWDENGEIAGGLYGVDAGGVFCGESMFFKRSNASKLCLLFLIDHLRSRGAQWIDCQVMTPHFEVLGARDIPREEFLDRLEAVQQQELALF